MSKIFLISALGIGSVYLLSKKTYYVPEIIISEDKKNELPDTFPEKYGYILDSYGGVILTGATSIGLALGINKLRNIKNEISLEYKNKPKKEKKPKDEPDFSPIYEFLNEFLNLDLVI